MMPYIAMHMFTSLHHANNVDLFPDVLCLEGDVYVPVPEGDVYVPVPEGDVYVPVPEGDVYVPVPEGDVYVPVPEGDVYVPVPEGDVYVPVPEGDVYVPVPESDVYVPVPEGDVYVPVPEGDVYVPVPEGDVYVPVPEGDVYVPVPESDVYVPVPEGDVYVPVPEGDVYVPVPEGDVYVPVPEGDVYVPEGDVYVPVPESDVYVPVPEGDVYVPVPEGDVYVPVPEENVACTKHGAQVLQGEMRTSLLDGDFNNYDMEKGFTRHHIDETGQGGIVVKLGAPYIVNFVRLLLWDKDMRSYSYYIEVSMDQKDWVRVVDHTRYLCRSWQKLYFHPRVVNFTAIAISVVCAAVPHFNVASLVERACVIEGVSRCRNALINGDTEHYDWDSGYTCHQLGSGAIVVQLAQPYMLSSMRLLLWDCDERTYSYYVEVSVDQITWTQVEDRRDKPCSSWQHLTFKPTPVVFIRIVGTHNTANEVSILAHIQLCGMLARSSRGCKERWVVRTHRRQNPEAKTREEIDRGGKIEGPRTTPRTTGVEATSVRTEL
ncbi:BTBD9 [Cordylochernes scorpioides]|uniref:BTBD9 n=1 Tax=Cordylochernes scorpioides TaxID=51811 RepID=A0ABY6KH51_9ARAC|nr:BTBD9 [Cordylochernes scorpioides]